MDAVVSRRSGIILQRHSSIHVRCSLLCLSYPQQLAGCEPSYHQAIFLNLEDMLLRTPLKKVPDGAVDRWAR